MTGAVVCGVLWLVTAPASALLIEKKPDSEWPKDPLELTYFYPYPTTYRYVDEGFAFEDDPLNAIVPEPYRMRLKVRRVTVRRSMVTPRMNFIKEMYRSVDSI